MILKDFYDKDIEVMAYRHEYMNDNLAIRLVTTYGEPWTTLTVNLGVKLPSNYAYVDTNNNPDIEKFIKDNELGEFAGGYMTSGYCRYPLYKFDLTKLLDGVM